MTRGSTPVDARTVGPATLQLVASLTAEIAGIERRREVAIFLAIDAGVPWAEIGRALGVTAQAAHKHYRWLRYNPITNETWHAPPLLHGGRRARSGGP